MGVIASIFPQSAQCDEPGTVTLNVYGSGFIAADKVNYDGADVGSTVFVSANLMQITLNPSGASRPKYVPVKVTGDTAVRLFNWTPGPTPGGPKSWYPPAP